MKSLFVGIILTSVFTMGCANMKYRGYAQGEEFPQMAAKMKGKSPKQVVEAMGQPMGAYYTNSSKNEYLLYYPVGAKETSMMDVVMNDDITCYWMMFEKSKKFVFDGEYYSKSAQNEICNGKILNAKGLILNDELVK